MILSEMYDTYYENTGFTTIRSSVRGLVRKDNLYAMIHIKCNDGFGERDHYEISGGGIEKGEDEKTALKRELLEEVGFGVKIEKKIGTIIDRWNLLERINVHHFYVCELIFEEEPQLTDYEKEVIVGVEWHTLDEWAEILSKETTGINAMIHQRELLVINEIKKSEN